MTEPTLHDACGCDDCLTALHRTEPTMSDATTRCDGDHAAPKCSDPQCWRTDTRIVVYEFDPDDSLSEIVERLFDPDSMQTVTCRRFVAVPWCVTHDSEMGHNQTACLKWCILDPGPTRGVCVLADPSPVFRIGGNDE